MSTDRNLDHENHGVSRRGFLGKLGLGALLLGIGGQGFAFMRSLLPNVLYEAPQKFKIGFPEEFPEGAKFLEDRKVFIFRDQKTYYAVSAICTHLGCTVKMVNLKQPKHVMVGDKTIEEKWEFQCPCHGSKYYGDGTNYAGPAPKPLEWYKLETSPDDGQLVVNMEVKVGQQFRLTV